MSPSLDQPGDGHAPVGWREEIPSGAVEALVARLNAARRLEGGKVSYRLNPEEGGDPFFEDAVGVVEAALRFPEGVPEGQARRAVGEALFDPAAGKLEGEGFVERVDRAVSVFLSREPEPYALVTRVSAKPFEGLGPREVGGCRLFFHPRPPERFRRGHARAENLARPRVPGDMGPRSFFRTRYLTVVAETEARSPVEAGAKAQRALALQRGLWNLALLRFAVAPRSSQAPNHIVPGPVQSVHREDGEALIWPTWYEPAYAGPVPSLQAGRLRQHWREVLGYEEQARADLDACRYREKVENFVVDFALALDGRDWEAAFFRLWGLLERMTGLGLLDPRERHSEVTRRAAFHVRSDLSDLQYQVLEKLRRQRNTGVHEGLFPEDSRGELLLLRRFVVLVLEFHLFDSVGIDSLEETVRFSSQPSEAERLRERIRTLERQGRAEDLRLARMAMEYHGHEA